MLYREVQHIRNGLLWIITVIAAGILVLAFRQNSFTPGMAITYAVIFLIVALIFVFAWTLKLTFTADDQVVSLRIKYLQTMPQTLKWEDLDHVWQAEINAVRDFGGWGLRYNSKATGYIFRSTTAIFFKTKKGQEIAVTTARGNEFIDLVAENHPELLTTAH